MRSRRGLSQSSKVWSLKLAHSSLRVCFSLPRRPIYCVGVGLRDLGRKDVQGTMGLKGDVEERGEVCTYMCGGQ